MPARSFLIGWFLLKEISDRWEFSWSTYEVIPVRSALGRCAVIRQTDLRVKAALAFGISVLGCVLVFGRFGHDFYLSGGAGD